jgi:SAM domain (Sterile alpha motif)
MPQRDRLVAGMQQIEEWLKDLGMPEYAERFAENKIDISALPVKSFSARRYLLCLIEATDLRTRDAATNNPFMFASFSGDCSWPRHSKRAIT